VRVLIVGYGRMGHFHARTVLAAGDTPITLDTHAPAEYKSWRTVGHIDAAIIACPIEHLYDHARRALDRGIPGPRREARCRDARAGPQPAPTSTLI
jgi:siroheme synthase (precorrin-2 oxidase/ferrochelatase)